MRTYTVDDIAPAVGVKVNDPENGPTALVEYSKPVTAPTLTLFAPRLEPLAVKEYTSDAKPAFE
jgi:hypothetical protein